MLWPSSLVLRMTAIAAALALVLGAGWAVLHALEGLRAAGDQAGYERAQAEHQAVALRATEQAREAERKAAAMVARIERESHDRQMAQERDATGARSELERLRNALSTVPTAGGGAAAADAAAPGRQHEPSAAAGVAAQCAGRLLEVAEAADAVTGQLLSLQDWVRTVPAACVASMAD